MKVLPIGIADFKMLRQENLLYVDKTGHLLNLIKNGRKYFLSRPRRFGKSLTLSTIGAMFSGQVDLFKGLQAEDWVKQQAEKPSPVLRFNMSESSTTDGLILNQSLKNMIARKARNIDVTLYSDLLPDMLIELVEGIYKKSGPVVVLIDEYDKPILDYISDVSKAEEMRNVLRGFYTTIKSCSDEGYMRFVMITGISKFSKTGVFSAMNDLLDISLSKKYSDIVGYTQGELEHNFADWIDDTAEKENISREKLLSDLKEYYDGFSFDGKVRLYNPFSILSFFENEEFNNYWYDSGSPSFIVNWMRQHHIESPEEYRHKIVDKEFTKSQEIERTDPASFLFQSGYLTIEKRTGDLVTLDYPNREVLDSLSKMYLRLIYKIEGYTSLGNDLWTALKNGDLPEIVRLYNQAIAYVAYDDFKLNKQNEFWYRSMFVMLLRGAGIRYYTEPHLAEGRPDLVIEFENIVIVLEFKFAKARTAKGKTGKKEATKSEVAKTEATTATTATTATAVDTVEEKGLEGLRQVLEKMYIEPYKSKNHKVICAVLVADEKKRQVTMFQLAG